MDIDHIELLKAVCDRQKTYIADLVNKNIILEARLKLLEQVNINNLEKEIQDTQVLSKVQQTVPESIKINRQNQFTR